MKDIRINIAVDSLMRLFRAEVYRLSKTTAGSDVEVQYNAQADKDDITDNMLAATYFVSGMSDMRTLTADFITGYTEHGSGRLPDNIDMGFSFPEQSSVTADVLKAKAGDYIVADMVRRWCSVTMPAYIQQSETRFRMCEGDMLNVIYHKNRPEL